MKAIRQNSRRGASLRQTLVAVIVVILLLTLLFPYLLQQRTASRRNVCSNRQLKLWQAAQSYNELKGHYPTYQTHWEGDVDQPQVGWVGGLLPYLESATKIKGPAPHAVANSYLKAHPGKIESSLKEIYLADLVCPADLAAESASSNAASSYVANTGMQDETPSDSGPADWPANGVLMDSDGFGKFPLKLTSREWVHAHDGENATLLIAENVDAGLWSDINEAQVGFVWRASYVNGQPARDNQLLAINAQAGRGDGGYRFARPSSHHGRGVNVVFCGGKLQFFAEDTDYLVLANLMNSDITATKMPGSDNALEAPYRLKPEELLTSPSSASPPVQK